MMLQCVTIGILFLQEDKDTFRISDLHECTFKDFFSKCDQIRSFLRIWSHLLKKSLMENFIFYAVYAP